MVNVGESLSGLPSQPLDLSSVEALEAHDNVVTAVPLVSRGVVNPGLVWRLLIQLQSTGALVEFQTTAGWVVKRAVSAEDATERELFQDLLKEAINWQQNQSKLVVALYDRRHYELRDLLDEYSREDGDPGPWSPFVTSRR